MEISVDQALKMMRRFKIEEEGREVTHTMKGTIGADWDSKRVEEAIRAYGGAEWAGPRFRDIGHAICVHYEGKYLYIETVEGNVTG